jgi:hypothetical protein
MTSMFARPARLSGDVTELPMPAMAASVDRIALGSCQGLFAAESA